MSFMDTFRVEANATCSAASHRSLLIALAIGYGLDVLLVLICLAAGVVVLTVMMTIAGLLSVAMTYTVWYHLRSYRRARDRGEMP